MSAEQVARLIADFDQPESANTRSRVVPFDHLHHSGVKPQHQPLMQPAQQKPAMQQPLHILQQPVTEPEDDGFERGRAEGYAAAQAEFEERLEHERQALAVQADEDRYRLLNEIAARLAGDITEAGNQVQERVAGVAARLLEPFVASIVEKQAIATFIEHLTSLTIDSRRPVLRISGPADLLDLIRGKLGVRAIAIELYPCSDAEASVVIDQLVVETQLQLWVDRLKLAVQT